MAAAATAAAGEKALQTFHDWCASEGVAFDREVRVCAKEACGITKTYKHFFGGVFWLVSVCGTRMLFFFDGIGTARPLFLANHLRLLSIHQQHMDVVYVQLAMLTRFSLLPPLSSHAYLPSPRRL